jgi:hypothetical protein
LAEPTRTKVRKRRRRLSDFEVTTVGLVKSGANRRRFPIVKNDPSSEGRALRQKHDEEGTAPNMDAAKLAQVDASLDLIDGLAASLMKSLEVPVAPTAPPADPKLSELANEVKAIAKRLEERDDEIAKLKASLVAKDTEIERIKADYERPSSNAIPVEGTPPVVQSTSWGDFFENLNRRAAR